jgi:hypothetical protein
VQPRHDTHFAHTEGALRLSDRLLGLLHKPLSKDLLNLGEPNAMTHTPRYERANKGANKTFRRDDGHGKHLFLGVIQDTCFYFTAILDFNKEERL